MKKIILLLFLLPCFLSGQDRTIDSLKLALKNAKHDTTRGKIYLHLGVKMYFEKPDTAIVLFQKAELLAEKNLPSKGVLKTSYLKILGKAAGFIGLIYDNQGDIPNALEYIHKSLKIYEERGDKKGIATSLNNIGIIYCNQGDNHKALEYYHKSLKIREEIGEKSEIATSLMNIGVIYKNHVDIHKALEYYHKSLKIYEEIGNKDGIASCLNNIGAIYKDRGDPQVTSSKQDGLRAGIQKALKYFHRSLKIYEEAGSKRGMAYSLNNIGGIYHTQGNLKEALYYGRRSMQLAKELGFPRNIKLSANLLKLIFQKQNKYKEAFEMYELEITMRDSISNEENQKAAIKKQLQYNYEKKAALDSTEHAKENEINNAEITARKAELKVKQNTQYALYGGLALVLIFAGLMFNRFKTTQKQKHIIEIKEKETQQQKHIIEEKHKEITDSINYAERIQRSFIATKEILDENLNDYFVLFKPKDVVSGDFYWASKLNNGNFALATADSTGHGVPGAIMSLLNITSLEKAIETLNNPSDILNSTRKTIIERLKKDGSAEGGKDGMDASLTVYDFKNKKLFIAAANNPVWIVRGTETIEIKPDKMPVGKHDRDTVSFSQQEIDLQTGDMVYTLTDGFPDQFGGEKGKKFMSKNLRELLCANAHLPMKEQKELLEKIFSNWVGNLEQVDDVTLIGVRV